MIERLRRRDTEEPPEPAPQPKLQAASARRLRPRIGKQFLNYPLARDIRTQQPWRRSKPKGLYWLCNLPGDERIEFRLRGDIEEPLRHCPTPFDVNVLLLILARAEQLERRQVNFASYNAMLRALKIGIDSGTRHRLHDSLDYWSELSIIYRECWHKVGQQEPITKRLLTPLESVAKEGHRIRITLDREWFDLRKRYFEKLTIPLPTSAAAQNLVLLLACRIPEPFTTQPYEDDPLRGHWTKEMSIETYCQKIGLTHSSRNAQFQRLLAEPLGAYYRSDGYDFRHLIKNGKILFSWFKREPPPPRVRLQPSKSAPGTTTATPQRKPVERVKRERVEPELQGQLISTIDEDGRKEMMWQRPDGELVSLGDVTDEERALVRKFRS